MPRLYDIADLSVIGTGVRGFAWMIWDRVMQGRLWLDLASGSILRIREYRSPQMHQIW